MANRMPIQRKNEYGDYAWPDCYYLELDAAKRLNMLNRYAQTEDPETIALMRKLFDVRYKKNPDGNYSDDFLFQLVQIKMIAENLDNLFGQKQRRRQVLKALDKLCLGKNSGYPEEMLYMEMCQLTAFFLTTCSVDKNYTAVLWGLGKVKDETMRKKIAHDLDLVGIAIPQYLKLEEECSILSQAVADTKEEFL